MDDRNGDSTRLDGSPNGTDDGANPNFSRGTMFVNNFDNEMPAVIAGSNVTLVAKRVGNNLDLTYTICPKSNDKVYTLNQYVRNIQTTTLDISLSAEFSTFKVTSSILKK